MSLIKCVVYANDNLLYKAHKEFANWKQQQLNSNSVSQYLAKTDFGWALRHFEKCKRSITKICPTFESQKSYARGISTTQVIGKNIYWKNHDDPVWKQSRRDPPPFARNGAPVKVLFDHEKDVLYRFAFI